jgi:NadR type nicotinamide-nucleotide adenylyltransferase
MIKKIAITGPESTGKSWLAEHLAKKYNTIWVPEYAREYLEKHPGKYTLDDIVAISVGQLNETNESILLANKLIISDTEMLVCFIWAEVVFGEVPTIIEKAFHDQRFDLYLLCDVDLPWEPDPLREHPDRRTEIFQLYFDALSAAGLPFEIISGFGDQRLERAVQAIESRLSL